MRFYVVRGRVERVGLQDREVVLIFYILCDINGGAAAFIVVIYTYVIDVLLIQ